MPTLPETVDVPAWKGHRKGPRAKPSNGVMRVDFHGGRVTDRQVAALAHARKHAAAMKPAIVEAILRVYPSLREWKPKPKTMTAARLKQHVALWEVLLTKDHFQGKGYVSWAFECSWDPSGFHVLTHGDRVVIAGDSEVLTYPHADPLRKPPVQKGPTEKQVRAAIAKARVEAAKNPKALPAEIDGEVWVTFPAWAGFHAGRDVSRGEAGVTVPDGETRPAHQSAYREALAKQVQHQGVVLAAIAQAYPKLVRGAEGQWPVSVDRAALRSLVTLTGVHLHGTSVGYELSCAWDREHGVGVVLRDGRAVKVGQASVAI